MTKKIINRVENSPLITIDLEDFYPLGERLTLDISQWLEQGQILVEHSFRESLKAYDWSLYQGTYVALLPLKDVIVPAWAYLLVTSYLSRAVRVIFGDLQTLENSIFQEAISQLDIAIYRDKPIIIKGCSQRVPQNAYLLLMQKLQPLAKKVMYGEACSAVPIYTFPKKS